MFNQDQANQVLASKGYMNLPTLYQQPYLNQREVLGSPITIGGGGSSGSKGKSWGL